MKAVSKSRDVNKKTLMVVLKNCIIHCWPFFPARSTSCVLLSFTKTMDTSNSNDTLLSSQMLWTDNKFLDVQTKGYEVNPLYYRILFPHLNLVDLKLNISIAESFIVWTVSTFIRGTKVQICKVRGDVCASCWIRMLHWHILSVLLLFQRLN